MAMFSKNIMNRPWKDSRRERNCPMNSDRLLKSTSTSFYKENEKQKNSDRNLK